MSTITCPGNPTTQAACTAIPNSFWISSTNTCLCCGTDGTSYLNTSGTSPVCSSCNGINCGGGGGYCNGSTQSSVPCVQNFSTSKWSAQCNNVCGGQCSGSCGVGEWFMFHKCTFDQPTGFYNCTTSATQWKSYLVYFSILFFIIAIVLLVLFGMRRTQPIQIPPGPYSKSSPTLRSYPYGGLSQLPY